MIKKLIERGRELIKTKARTLNLIRPSYPPDFSDENIAICNKVKPYTMTSNERVNALIDAVRYIVKNNIEGDMVECGVWKGGSAMAMMLTLIELNDRTREFYLYDTFSGMTAPGVNDVSYEGQKAHESFSYLKTSEDASKWCLSALDEVKTNVRNTGYQLSQVNFIKGKVENTIPKHIPSKIALLRLDTDWYESTKHELTYLFPRLQKNGVLLIDDYGHWVGARKAVDEYFAENEICMLLNRIDYTGRIGVKAGCGQGDRAAT